MSDLEVPVNIRTIATATLLIVAASRADVLVNEGFENGTTALTASRFAVAAASSATGWNQWANSRPGVQTQLSTDHVLEGSYSAHILGNTNNGLFQYHDYAPDNYTLSAWFWIESGSGHLGLFYDNGSNGTFGSSTSGTGAWEYLSVTNYLASGAGGGVVYTASQASNIYVDGLWMNGGTASTSPWDPSTGFNPNAGPGTVPEPATSALMAIGLAALMLVRRPRNS